MRFVADCNNRKSCQINKSIGGQCWDSERRMSSRESAMGHPDDIDRIALTVVEQIQQQMQVYEDAAASHSNEHDFKQVELHIQAKRIENILDTCLSKIEFALSMPWIFQSGAQNDECKSIQEKWKEIHERIESVCKQRQAGEMEWFFNRENCNICRHRNKVITAKCTSSYTIALNQRTEVD